MYEGTVTDNSKFGPCLGLAITYMPMTGRGYGFGFRGSTQISRYSDGLEGAVDLLLVAELRR
jgi:hypothetical protein